MPYTALGGSTGTVTVGDVTLGLFPQQLHPNVRKYISLLVADGYSPSRGRVDALNNLVWGLVGTGLWDLCDVIYPFLGGTTSATHRWNIKNLADTNAAFRITWTGSSNITFSENGIQNVLQTTATFGNTNYYPGIEHVIVGSNKNNGNNVHLSAYLNIVPSNNTTAIMGLGASGTNAFQLGRSTGGVLFGNPNSSNSSFMSAGTPTTGFFMPVRTASTTSTFYKNGLSVATSTAGTVIPSSLYSAYLLARGGSEPAYMNGRIAFASMGAGMTARQALDFYILVQSYQRALGRQV